MPAQVAVVVPTLGLRPRWFKRCVQSIVRQDSPAEIVVVAPREAEIDHAWVDRVRAKLVICDEPGLAAAITAGWNAVGDAPYITWLGDDDLLAPGCLAVTTSMLERHPSAPMVYGRARYIDEDDRSLWLSYPTRLAAPYLRFGKNFVTQQGSLLRREFVERVGGLDHSLRNSMDQDLFTRLAAAGRCRFVSRELGAYRWHSGSITWRKGAADEGELVRRRYIRQERLGAYLRWRRVGRYVDWWWDATTRRLPTPAPPLIDGLPYYTIDVD